MPTPDADTAATLDEPARWPVFGAGLGLRRGLVDALMADTPSEVDFMEIAPENWIRVGGKLGRKLRFFTERYPFLLHGLSLSIGGPSPLDEELLLDISGNSSTSPRTSATRSTGPRRPASRTAVWRSTASCSSIT